MPTNNNTINDRASAYEMMRESKQKQDARDMMESLLSKADRVASARNNAVADYLDTTEKKSLLSEKRRRPLTRLGFVASCLLCGCVAGGLLTTEAMITGETFEGLFGTISASSAASVIAGIAGALMAILTLFAGKVFSDAVLDAEENPVTHKKDYDKVHLLLPLIYLAVFLCFQIGTITFLGGEAATGRTVCGLAIIEFLAGLLLHNPLRSVELGFLILRSQHLYLRMSRLKETVQKLYGTYCFMVEDYNTMYSPNPSLVPKKTPLIDATLNEGVEGDASVSTPAPAPAPARATPKGDNTSVDGVIDDVIEDILTDNDESEDTYAL